MVVEVMYTLHEWESAAYREVKLEMKQGYKRRSVSTCVDDDGEGTDMNIPGWWNRPLVNLRKAQ